MKNRDNHSRDMLLAEFVADAQNEQLQLPITVSVSGVFYSGLLGTFTDFWEYLQTLKD
jgi:hypothetical protein